MALNKKTSLVFLALGFSAPIASEPIWSPTKVGQVLGCKAIAAYTDRHDAMTSLDLFAKNLAGGPIEGISNFYRDAQIQREFYAIEAEQLEAMTTLVGSVLKDSRAEWLWDSGSCFELYSESRSLR